MVATQIQLPGVSQRKELVLSNDCRYHIRLNWKVSLNYLCFLSVMRYDMLIIARFKVIIESKQEDHHSLVRLK